MMPVQPASKERPFDIPADEYEGVVYNGLLWKDLRPNEFEAWPLNRISRDLDIAMTVPDNPPEYKDAIIPLKILLGNASVAFALDTGNVKNAIDLQFPERANAVYSVSKNGKTQQLKKPPFIYRGSGPYVDLKEFLTLMDLDYAESGQTLYVGSRGSGEIKGKVMSHDVFQTRDPEDADVKLIYLYDPANIPRYRTIELVIGGERVVLFDNDRPGRSAYYNSGSAEFAEYQGETFLQVHLDQDTVILKKISGQWKPIFSATQYAAFDSGRFSLKIEADGSASFVDTIRHAEHHVHASGGTPGKVYPVTIQGFARDMSVDGPFSIVAQIGAREEGRIVFSGQVRFVYNGDTLVPAEIASWDEQKYGQDKAAGKTILTKDDYLQFRYSLP